MTSKGPPNYLPSMGRLLGFAHATCTQVSNERLKTEGITIQQWIVLTALWRSESMSESDLAIYCKMSMSSTNRLVDRMVDKQLIFRKKDPNDGRRKIVHVGVEGKKRKHLLTFYEEINEIVLTDFSDEEKKTFADLLERATVNLKAASVAATSETNLKSGDL